MTTHPEWHLVERTTDGGAFEVWLDEHPNPDVIGANSIVLGAGLTRAAARLNALEELLAQTHALCARVTQPRMDGSGAR